MTPESSSRSNDLVKQERAMSNKSSRKCKTLKLKSQVVSICWREAVSQLQRAYLLAVLVHFKGNRTIAARELGITRRTLQLQLKELLPEFYGKNCKKFPLSDVAHEVVEHDETSGAKERTSSPSKPKAWKGQTAAAQDTL
jgi:DNA-binding protein Fis